MKVQPTAYMIVVFFGMTATGKSTLGRTLATYCNAPYFNTDLIRKELAGVEAVHRQHEDIGEGIYSRVFSEKTYQALLDRANEEFVAGERLVILDGSYSRRADRDRVRELAARWDGKSVFIHCICSEEEVRHRLSKRAADPSAVSDGRWEVYLHQQKTFEKPDHLEEPDCLQLNTEQPAADMMDWLTAQLGLSR
ncbi:MAG: AAA family ATPase [Desulfobulbus sp.]|nr:AAA family ATPase [Desulfobulbus sp.]